MTEETLDDKLKELVETYKEHKEVEKTLKELKESVAQDMTFNQTNEIKSNGKIIVRISNKSVAVCGDERSATYIKGKFWPI